MIQALTVYVFIFCVVVGLYWFYLLRSARRSSVCRAAYRSKAIGLTRVMAVLSRGPAKMVDMASDIGVLGGLADEAFTLGLYELPEFNDKMVAVRGASNPHDVYRRLCLSMGIEDGNSEVVIDIFRYRLACDIEREIIDAVEHMV